MTDRECGHCRYFDGDGWLDDDGTGKGECCYDPPVWVGPSPTGIDLDTWTESLEHFWEHPMVGVAQAACHHFEEPYKKRWWEVCRENRGEPRTDAQNG